MARKPKTKAEIRADERVRKLRAETRKLKSTSTKQIKAGDAAKKRIKAADVKIKTKKSLRGRMATASRTKAAKAVKPKAFAKAVTGEAAKKRPIRSIKKPTKTAKAASKVGSKVGRGVRAVKQGAKKTRQLGRVLRKTGLYSKTGKALAKKVLTKGTPVIAAGVAGYELGTALGGEKYGRKIGKTLAKNKARADKIKRDEAKLVALRKKTAARKAELKAGKPRETTKPAAKAVSTRTSKPTKRKAAKGFGIDLYTAADKLRAKRKRNKKK